jgi:hypothetical protein
MSRAARGGPHWPGLYRGSCPCWQRVCYIGFEPGRAGGYKALVLFAAQWVKCMTVPTLMGAKTMWHDPHRIIRLA